MPEGYTRGERDYNMSLPALRLMVETGKVPQEMLEEVNIAIAQAANEKKMNVQLRLSEEIVRKLDDLYTRIRTLQKPPE